MLKLDYRTVFAKKIYDQIVLVCVTNFGHIRNKGLISAQLVEGKEDGDEWEWIGMGGRVWEWILVGGSVWEWVGVDGSGLQLVGFGEGGWKHGLVEPIP